jgi:DNA-binding transcriptional regulator of glucitol operon
MVPIDNDMLKKARFASQSYNLYLQEKEEESKRHEREKGLAQQMEEIEKKKTNKWEKKTNHELESDLKDYKDKYKENDKIVLKMSKKATELLAEAIKDKDMASVDLT